MLNGTEEPTAIENYESWEVENFVDDAQAVGIIDAFVYSFKQGGREVTGLTARAIEEICLLNKPRVSIDSSEVTDEGDTVFAKATAIAKYIVPPTKETRPDGTIIETEGYEEVVTADGVRREPAFLSNGKRDPHVEMKALTKAMRAARRQLISQAAQIQAKEQLLQRQGGKPVPVPRAALPKPPQQQNGNGSPQENATTQAMKACFATFGEKEDDLAEKGVSKDAFWNTLKDVLGVASRTEMNHKQWDDVRTALKTKGYGKIVNDIIAKVKGTATETSEETEKGGKSPSDNSDNDIPF